MRKLRTLLYCLLACGSPQQLLWAVDFINVTEKPIYFAVYYRRRANQAIRYSAPKEGFYYIDKGLLEEGKEPFTQVSFKWPEQVCESRGAVLGECRSYYPRTVFFSFEKQDIIAGQADISNPQGVSTTVYLDKAIGSALYHGWKVEEGKTYVIFYNPYGFDPLYAVYGKHNSDIKAGKLNAAEYDKKDPHLRFLRYYLDFARYTFFGK